MRTLQVFSLAHDEKALDSNAEAQYILASEIKKRMKSGKIEVYKGNPKIWNVLDNSYDVEQKVKSQLDVNDQKLMRTFTEDGLALKSKTDDMESDVEDSYETVPTKTKYYD